MEERLDDALNVLRNHCEPQLGITTSNMDGPPYGSSPGGSQSNEPPPTIKLEKSTSKFSRFWFLCINIYLLFIFVCM